MYEVVLSVHALRQRPGEHPVLLRSIARVDDDAIIFPWHWRCRTALSFVVSELHLTFVNGWCAGGLLLLRGVWGGKRACRAVLRRMYSVLHGQICCAVDFHTRADSLLLLRLWLLRERTSWRSERSWLSGSIVLPAERLQVLPQWRAPTYKGLHVRAAHCPQLLLLLDLLSLLSQKVF